MKNLIGKTAITFGVFDLLHFGHFELFRRIRELVGTEGRLIVALQDDDWVTKFKDVKLVYDFNTRKRMIETLRTVTRVVPYTQVDETICAHDFDVAVFGCDQNHAGFQRAIAWCRDNGREVVILPRTDGISTSRLKEIIGGARA